MSTVGLTKAQDRELRRIAAGGHPYAGTRGGFRAGRGARSSLIGRMEDHGLLVRYCHSVDADKRVTPRGHAALAAPRMTQAEFAMMECAEVEGSVYYDTSRSMSAQCLVRNRIRERGWIDYARSLTPAGRTALNNVRAAMMGSPDWKEGL